MKNIIISKRDYTFVNFESAMGNGVAIWAGKNPPPHSYLQVELDIDDYFVWGENINIINESESRIYFHDGKLIFKAKIVAYEDDGVLTVSLDSDVIFIEVSGAAIDIEDGYVSFFTTPDRVTLYPIEL